LAAGKRLAVIVSFATRNTVECQFYSVKMRNVVLPEVVWIRLESVLEGMELKNESDSQVLSVNRYYSVGLPGLFS
jgi:hypothetical protein